MSTKPTGLIDLHCDTLTSFPGRGAYEQRLKRCPDDGEAFDALLERMRTADSLEDPANTLALSRMPKPFQWAQFFAVFIPDWIRGEKAWRYFEAGCASFERQMKIFREIVAPCCDFTDMVNAFTASKCAAFLTVEGGAVLAGELGRVKVLAERGVAALTLVWNGENELGSGQEYPETGLTPFGRLAVAELERCGILIILPFKGFQHLKRKGFGAVAIPVALQLGHDAGTGGNGKAEAVLLPAQVGRRHHQPFSGCRTDDGDHAANDLFFFIRGGQTFSFLLLVHNPSPLKSRPAQQNVHPAARRHC